MKYLALVLALVVCFQLEADSEQQIKDRMKLDLEIIRSAFEVGYAPKEWKLKYAGWDLDTEIAKAKDKVQNAQNITIKQYQKILNDFFNSAKDYHVGILFHSTEKAMLPFNVKGADGRYFISYVDTTKLSRDNYHIFEGDELVTFGGRPTHEVVQELRTTYTRLASELTDQSIAEMMLTRRSGRAGMLVPRGPIVVGIKAPNEERIVQYQLIWNYSSERINNTLNPILAESLDASDQLLPFFDTLMLSPWYGIFADKEKPEEDVKKSKKPVDLDMLGGRKSFIPDLGRVWWESSPKNPFDAYIYENEDHRLIGYLRIPRYLGTTESIKEFEKIIKLFQERTDALIIDQINNPGGELFYTYTLLSMLTEKPLQTPLHRMTITQDDVALSVATIPILENVRNDEDASKLTKLTLYGFPATHQTVQFILDYRFFIISEWNAGRFLTKPHHLFCIDHINPNPKTRYTKPILILINQLDLSCADFFPAIMQDNKRATLLGTRTAGAGGYVRSYRFPNRYGIDLFTYTGCISERADKNPIENLGVMPDIPYSLTQDDLQNNYKGYVKAINETVKRLVK